MSWLRIDDGFTQHPKVLKLPRGDRWTWLDVLCYCARYRTDGVVGQEISDSVRGATAGFLSRCSDLGLLDVVAVDNPMYVVHDWAFYNGTIEQRVHAYLDDHPQAAANEVFRAVGGTRDVVLDAVRKYRQGYPQNGTAGTSNGGTARTSKTGDQVVRPPVLTPSPMKVKSKQAGRSALRGPAEPAGLDHIAEDVDAFRREHGLDDHEGTSE